MRPISADKRKYYSLTAKGRDELASACSVFSRAFYDAGEMFVCGSCKDRC